MTTDAQATTKLATLMARLEGLGSAAVAFSGGVDSTLLLWLAHQELGNNCIAITARSKLFPYRETHEAQEFCQTHNITQLFIDRNELALPNFAKNSPDRCYICKRDMLERVQQLARQHGITNILEGSNLDDTYDYRPGARAITELGVLSPLVDATLTKTEIRTLSKELGLATFDKPSFACLATRFPYETQITPQLLERVDKSEQFLLDIGFSQVRVRSHGDVARIETDYAELAKFCNAEVRQLVHETLRGLGFGFVALDLMGYRSGSMNDAL